MALPARFWASILIATLAACSTPQEKEAKHLKLGQAFLAAGQFSKARVEFVDAARLQPADPTPLYYIGLTQEALGDPLGAFRAFSASEQQNKHYRPAVLKMAQYYLAGDDADDAAKRADILLADNPRDADAHALRGSVLLRQQDNSGALHEGETALALDPKNLDGAALLVGLYAAEGDEASMTRVLDVAIARSPQEFSLRTLAVSAYQKLGDMPQVEQGYRTLLRLAPPPAAEYRFDLSDLYVKEGKIDAAEAVLREGLAAAPGDKAIERKYVRFLSTNRGLNAAVAQLKAYIAGAPADTAYPLWLADLYWTHGDTAGTLAYLQNLQQQATSPDELKQIRTMLAGAQLAIGDAHAAETSVDRILSSDPGNVPALYVRANIEARAGQAQAAVTDLRAIIQQSPDDDDAQNLLAELLLGQGHADLAADTLGENVEHNPGDLHALVRLAQMDHLLGNTDRAYELLADVTRNAPEYAPGWESTARIAEDQHDWDKAEAAIDQLSALPGQQDLSDFLRAMLLAGKGANTGAVASLVTLINHTPRSPIAGRSVDLLLRLEAQQGKCAEALGLLEPLDIDPGIKASDMGACQLALGRYADAQMSFDTAIRLGVTRPDVYLSRAALYGRAKDVGGEIGILQTGHARSPGDTRIPLELAGALSDSGKYDEAMRLYAALLSQNPSLDVAANNLAALIADHAYQDKSQLTRARILAERFQASDNPDLLDTLGWVYYREGAIDDAISIYSRAVRSGPLSPTVRYHYAQVLVRENQPDAAKAQIRAAIASGGASFPDLAAAQRLLGTL